MTGSLPGIFLTLIGIMCVMLVQVGRATVDTAEMTGKLLKNSNEELKLLKSQGARPAGTTKAGASFEGSTDRSAPDGSAAKSDMAKQRGERISSVIDGMHGDRKSLARRDEAKVPVDPMRSSLGSPKPLGERIEPTMSANPSAKQHVHNGKTIRETETGAFVGMMRFDDLDGAREFIDQKLIPSERASKS